MARRPLPASAGPPSIFGGQLHGTIWVAAGMGLLGLAGYVFLTVTARAVPADAYPALTSLYLLIAVVGPGVFGGYEFETARLVSARLALAEGTRPVAEQLAAAAAASLGLAVLGLGALAPLLASRVFGDRWWLFAALLASVVGYAGVYLTRGLFAGQRRLRGYAASIGAEGAIRLLPCLALAAAGVGAATPYGVAIGLGPLAAALAVLPWVRTGGPGRRLPWRAVFAAVGWLTASSVLSLALANVAPVVVTALLPGDADTAGAFAFAFVISRVPLFVFVTAQAVLLPALSRAAARRDAAALRAGVRQALVVVAALGGVGVAAAAPVGGWLMGVVLGAGRSVAPVVLVLLAIGTVVGMLVLVLQPTLIALAGHHRVAGAWLLGVGCFAGAFLLPLAPVWAAVTAQLAGLGATAAALALGIAAQVRRHGLTRTGPAQEARL